MNKFEKIYNEYIEKPVLKFDGNVIDLYVDREDMLHLLEYGKDLEQVLNKIKEILNELNKTSYNATPYIIAITEIYKILEEIE